MANNTYESVLAQLKRYATLERVYAQCDFNSVLASALLVAQGFKKSNGRDFSPSDLRMFRTRNETLRPDQREVLFEAYTLLSQLGAQERDTDAKSPEELV